MSVECVQASAFDVGSDVTMQHYNFSEKNIRSNHKKFTFMQRQSPKPFTFLTGSLYFLLMFQLYNCCGIVITLSLPQLLLPPGCVSVL